MKEKRLKNQYFFIAVYVVLVLLTAFVGLHFVNIYFSSNSSAINQTTYDKYYVMITDDNKSNFWHSVYEGAYNYGLSKNVFVEDLASTFSNELTKEELMRIAIASDVDGILVSADDSEEMRTLIDEASSRNIPVVTMYNDSASSSRISYIGVDNYNIGKEYGREALGLAGDIHANDYNQDINVVVLVDSVPSQDQLMIYSTVQETFETDALSNVLDLSMVMIDSTNTFAVEETIRDLFLSENVPDIIICLSEINTTCVYQAVIDYNKVGSVNILGYFDSDSILHGIERNIIDSTIMIDTTQMGVYCIDALIEYDAVGFTNQYFAVDIAKINIYNVNQYLEDSENEN